MIGLAGVTGSVGVLAVVLAAGGPRDARTVAVAGGAVGLALAAQVPTGERVTRQEGYPVLDDVGVQFELERWANPRVLRKEATVAAAAEEVWKAWTDSKAMAKFFAENSEIELEPGGAYEMYFSMEPPPGSRGAEGCTVLTYVPYELLAFTWNAPPKIPTLREAQARTQVVLRFRAKGPEETHVVLTQHGFGESPVWQEYYEYFDAAWGRVFQSMVENIKGGSHKPIEPTTARKDGEVTVRAFAQPAKWQDFEVTLPAKPTEVWSILATVEGVKSFYPSNPVIELWPGGKWDLHGGKPNRIMAFIPNEVLAATGSAPDKFPTVQKGGTWGVFFLDSIGDNQTKLRLASVGWKEGGEWDQAFEYFLKANAQFLNMMHKHFAQSDEATESRGEGGK